MTKQERERLFRRLAGDTSDRTEYIVAVEDNCSATYRDYIDGYGYAHSHEPEVRSFPTLEEALAYLKGRYANSTPCPEDGRILVWEVLPSGHRKVVWHFSGWHFMPEAYTTLDQGVLPGDAKSLYSRAMDDELTDDGWWS
ncbi:hypothetical protein P74p19 [Thermus phage P74-26]|uniref:Uncharacterized protein n=1 Tax=Thermus phage P74-26 TaxID=2914007 RepID=A7XXI3_BP742|nr:hypothetical protein P74p19 [Thermus phage P74-26]ABU96969.1 hypothetical protein P74p19 [Thermus phage P74-26]